ncbi:MAG: hypothetical protein K2X47_06925 [Bdellovibrionales bacterium]|nr:hypothetical protein [Bdellovibrionales bacterium]
MVEKFFDRLLEAETHSIPNLKFELNEVQRREVGGAISLIQSRKSSNIWFGPHSLTANGLSIHPLDLLNVLSRCHCNSGTEIELYRIRKEAMNQMVRLRRRARNTMKIRTIEAWLEQYGKPWIGIDAPKVSLKPAGET